MRKQYQLKHTNMSGVTITKEVSWLGLMWHLHLFAGEKIEVTLL